MDYNSCLKNQANRPGAEKEQAPKCIVLTGMPGSGKSSVGAALSKTIHWAYIDTDYLLEAWYGLCLEELKNELGRNKFLQAEEKCILELKQEQCIIATGGSVVYSPYAMEKLKLLGWIIYLKADIHTLQKRINAHPERGLILNPDQSLTDILAERKPLYEKYADHSLRTDNTTLNECVQSIKEWLKIETDIFT